MIVSLLTLLIMIVSLQLKWHHLLMLYYLSILLFVSTVTALNFQLHPGVERCFNVTGDDQYQI
jgi:hypothetical protein